MAARILPSTQRVYVVGPASRLMRIAAWFGVASWEVRRELDDALVSEHRTQGGAQEEMHRVNGPVLGTLELTPRKWGGR